MLPRPTRARKRRRLWAVERNLHLLSRLRAPRTPAFLERRARQASAEAEAAAVAEVVDAANSSVRTALMRRVSSLSSRTITTRTTILPADSAAASVEIAVAVAAEAVPHLRVVSLAEVVAPEEVAFPEVEIDPGLPKSTEAVAK